MLGPLPDRLHPSAPPRNAASLTASKQATAPRTLRLDDHVAQRAPDQFNVTGSAGSNEAGQIALLLEPLRHRILFLQALAGMRSVDLQFRVQQHGVHAARRRQPDDVR